MPRLFTAAELGIDPSRLGPNSPLRETKQRSRPRDLEHPEQSAVVAWALANEDRYPDLRWLFAVPNFAGLYGSKGARMITARRLREQGRKKNVPDLWFPAARGPWKGLVIEMKAGNGKPTKGQREWIDHLQRQGWHATVCYSGTEAIALLEHYLRLGA